MNEFLPVRLSRDILIDQNADTESSKFDPVLPFHGYWIRSTGRQKISLKCFTWKGEQLQSKNVKMNMPGFGKKNIVYMDLRHPCGEQHR